MSIGLKYILDTRRKKKDGTHSLRLRVTINRQSFEIGSGYSLKLESWDEKRQQVKKKSKEFSNVARINNLLTHRKAEILDKLTKMDEEGSLTTLSTQGIKEQITGKKRQNLTYEFWHDLIEEMKMAGSVGNARVYNMVLNSVKNFTNKDFPLQQITFAWLKKYEAWYLSRQNSQGKPNTINGLGVNMRTIRAVINRAIKQNILSQDHYPFKNYTIRKEATRKRAISTLDLVKLKNVTPKTERQKKAKRYFFMSYYLMGASFIDLAFLKYENIKNGRIEYKRRKTGRLHSIKVSEKLEELLRPFLQDNTKSDDDFLLPILSKNQTIEQQYTAARDEMRRYNRSLKELGKMAELSIPLTSYVARHSYATIAKYQGMPTSLISEALGHSTEEVTQIYLASFEQNVLDDWNDKIQSTIS